MKCFTIVLPTHRNVLPNRFNREKSECDVLLLNPYKQGITPRRLHTVTPEVRCKGAGKKAKATLSLTDMGALN